MEASEMAPRGSYLISSNISGFCCSRSFIRSLMALTMELALSSAPCLELFSAAPEVKLSQRMKKERMRKTEQTMKFEGPQKATCLLQRNTLRERQLHSFSFYNCSFPPVQVNL